MSEMTDQDYLSAGAPGVFAYYRANPQSFAVTLIPLLHFVKMDIREGQDDRALERLDEIATLISDVLGRKVEN